MSCHSPNPNEPKPACSPNDCAGSCKKLVDDVKDFVPKFQAHPDAGRNMDLLAGGLERIEQLSRRRFLSMGTKTAGGMLLGSAFITTFMSYLGVQLTF